MVLTIIIAILAILLMLICILKFPIIKIGHREIETFFIPLLIGALILLIFPIFDKSDLKDILFSNSKLNPIKILILFISISFISISLDEAGFFSFVAIKFINKFKNSQYKLFFSLYILISILTIFTSNDIVILTFTPFIIYFSKRGNINPIPFLVMEFVAANTYSMLLPIGNPTNIYLSSIYELSFIKYIKYMIIPTIICGITSLLVMLLIFKKELKKEINVFDNHNNYLKNKFLTIISLLHLSFTTILLVISNYIDIEMYIISLSFGISLLIFLIIYSIYKHNKLYALTSIRRLPYTLIPFILSMFIIIMALKSYDIFENISNLFNKIDNKNIQNITYLTSSTLSCNIINNIPMTIAYGSILELNESTSNIYYTIIGSNIGAILTPVGALAGIMWIKILKQNGIKYSFLDFVKNGIIIVVSIIITLTIFIFLI